MSEICGTIAEVRRETPDAVTIRIDLGNAPFAYRPGQYIEIDPHQFLELKERLDELETAKGFPEPPRGFSLCSDGSDPGIVEISVKEERARKYPPVLSPWLVRQATPGRTILFTGPAGLFCLTESPPPVDGFLHLSAGSGVAPIRGIIRCALRSGWPQRHLLVLQNRTEEDIFYRSEWPEIEKAHPGKLRVRHVFSGRDGQHVDSAILRDAMEGWIDGARAWAFVCGPNRPREVVRANGTTEKEPGFCEKWAGNPRRKTTGALEELGFESARILTEMW